MSQFLHAALRESEHDQYKNTAGSIAVHYGIAGAGLYAFNSHFGNIPIDGVKVGSLKYAKMFSYGGQPWYKALGLNGHSSATTKMMLFETAKYLEERTFMKIPRTFSFSTMLGESIMREATMDLPYEMLKPQAKYLKNISEGAITDSMLQQGLKYKNGSLYHGTQNVLNNAVLSPGRWGVGLESSYHSSLNKAAYAAKNMELYGDSEWIIKGGQTWGKAKLNSIETLATKSMQGYMKVLNNPAEVILDAMEAAGKASPAMENMAERFSSMWKRNGLDMFFGTGGKPVTGQGLKNLSKAHAFRALPMFALGAAAFGLADEMMRQIPLLNQTQLGGGIKGMTASAYQDTSMSFAKASDITGMTLLSKGQEEVAPGSTSLLGLAAVPLSLGIFGSTMGWFGETARYLGPEEVINTPGVVADRIEGALNMVHKLGLPDNLIDSHNIADKLKGATAKRGLGVAGALIGTALISPFILGSLGSSKSESELEDIYSGRKKVEKRRGRFWFFGQQDYEGEDTEYFKPHWTNLAISDSVKKSQMPEEYYGHPIKRLLERIITPYAKEMRMDDERPYTYWGSSDWGLGLFEALAAPLKEIVKPTRLAHPESLGIDPVSRMKYTSMPTPDELQGTELGMTTRGYLPIPHSPDGVQSMADKMVRSAENASGLHGFAFRTLTGKLAGAKGLLTPDAVYQSSGNIDSASRNYWDKGLGDMFMTNEWYRRMNNDSPYQIENVSSAIRNTQPTWMPTEFLAGDPYASIAEGDYRLAGRGYASLHKEVSGLDPEDYPLIHRMAILNDVAPHSSKYYMAANQVENLALEGKLDKRSQGMYDEIQRQRAQIEDEAINGRFDNGSPIIGDYWLGIKKLGHNLPTESLYPLSPIMKFSGAVDPITDYRSTQVLDKNFKSWENPISDFIKPALNKTLNIASLGTGYYPEEYENKLQFDSYFDKLQSKKNSILDERAKEYAANKQYDLASYMHSGKRDTVYDANIYGNSDEVRDSFSPTQQKYFNAFSNMKGNDKVLEMASPEMATVLRGQWRKQSAMSNGQMDLASSLEKNSPTLGQAMDVESSYGSMPGKDFIGYAPGVNLNAFKVKVANNLGKNIRDHNLWREDERQATIMDSMLVGASARGYSTPNMSSKQEAIYQANKVFNSIGLQTANITATPIRGGSVVQFDGSYDNRENIKTGLSNLGHI